MDNIELIRSLQELAFPLKDTEGREQLRSSLAEYINELLQTNFEQLVNILYRLDIDEQRLRELLREKPAEDAAGLIAELVIERQLQRIHARKQFRRPDQPIDEDESW